MWKYITKEQSNDFLFSLHLLNIDNKNKYIKKLYSISNNIENNYKVFKIKKKSGGYRTIYEPSDTLKHIQRMILMFILNNKKISDYAKAYKSGISLKDNAIPHINKKIILKLDIKNFFESINFYHIKKSCFPIEYFPDNIGTLLTYLCTYDGFLPQGAPTSAYISNLVMKDFDYEVGIWANNKNISYTRYSDDMTFSGDFNPSEVIKYVKKELSLLGLHLNKNKIHVIKNNKRQLVTGLVVNEKLNIDRNYRNKIRQEIYYIKKFGLASHLLKIKEIQEKFDYLMSLYGRILFVLQINKEDIEFLEYKKTILKMLKEL